MLNFNDFFFVNSEVSRNIYRDINFSIKSVTFDGTRSSCEEVFNKSFSIPFAIPHPIVFDII